MRKENNECKIVKTVIDDGKEVIGWRSAKVDMSMEGKMKKYIPRVGTKFDSREKLLEKLEESGWKFEGEGSAFLNGKVTEIDLGVVDEKNDKWLMIYMRPSGKMIKVNKVDKLKLSDFDKGGKYDLDSKKKVTKRTKK